jgi:hypothetical protein
MRTRSTLTRAVFGTAVVAALGFGVTSANAAPSAAKAVACPGYMSSAQACTDCCAQQYGGVGFWSPGTRYCNCAL